MRRRSFSLRNSPGATVLLLLRFLVKSCSSSPALGSNRASVFRADEIRVGGAECRLRLSGLEAKLAWFWRRLAWDSGGRTCGRGGGGVFP